MTVMTINEVEFEKETVKVDFFCKVCNKRHKLDVNKDIFEEKKFPVAYIYIHGENQTVATLYIDAAYRVRGVEFPKGIGVNKDQLSDILNKSKSLNLTGIPSEMIYAFQVSENRNILKIYFQEGYEKHINFNLIKKFFRNSEKFSKHKEECNEFYMRYSEYWISAVKMFDYTLIMVIDSSIDIDHLKTQLMGFLETFLS
jgi:hypothetical protein